MLKLKPIAEEILRESDDVITWGDVKQFFQEMKSREITDKGKSFGTTAGKIALNFLTAGVGSEILNFAMDVASEVDITNPKSIGKGLLDISKLSSEAQLKNPRDSKFKKLTGKFWDSIKLDSRISTILDDKIEAEFLNTVIYPQMSRPGNDSEPIPNMNYELGKWLNEKGLKTAGNEADIFFTGKDQEI